MKSRGARFVTAEGSAGGRASTSLVTHFESVREVAVILNPCCIKFTLPPRVAPFDDELIRRPSSLLLLIRLTRVIRLTR
jgi:hypothetical protein